MKLRDKVRRDEVFPSDHVTGKHNEVQYYVNHHTSADDAGHCTATLVHANKQEMMWRYDDPLSKDKLT